MHNFHIGDIVRITRKVETNVRWNPSGRMGPTLNCTGIITSISNVFAVVEFKRISLGKWRYDVSCLDLEIDDERLKQYDR